MPSPEASTIPTARTAARRAGIVALVCLVVVSVAFAVDSQLGALSEVRARPRPLWLIPATLALFFFAASHAEVWRWMIRGMGFRVAPWRARALFNASALARYVPTGIATFVVRIELAHREGVPRAVTATALVYEIGLSLAAALLLGCWFIADLPQLRGEHLRFVVLPVAVAVIALLHPRFFVPISDRLLRRLGREPLAVTMSFARVMIATCAYTAGFLLAGLGLYAVAGSLAGVQADDLPTAIGAYSIGFAAGFAGAALPGGLGAREGATAIALTSMLSAPLAVAAAVVTRLLQLAIELSYSGVSALIARRSPSLASDDDDALARVPGKEQPAESNLQGGGRAEERQLKGPR